MDPNNNNICVPIENQENCIGTGGGVNCMFFKEMQMNLKDTEEF